MKRIFLLLFCILLVVNSNAQTKDWKNEATSSFLIGAHYSPSFALGDLQKRYSFLNHIGADLSYKTTSNWIFGGDFSFIFGNKTKLTGLFDNLVDGHGNISNADGNVGIVLANPRGWSVNAHFGKVFSVGKSNPNSGIFLRINLGYLEHKLYIETRDDVIPLLEKNYRKGYDRFASGLATEQFLGYLFMGDNEFLNFYAGAFIQEGFTRNRRNMNYDQPDIPVDKSLRIDVMVGLKFAWTFPAYSRYSRDYYTK